MGKIVVHAITVSKTGTAYVTCSEDEHHPEKLIDDVGVKPVGERVGEVDHLAESLHWNDPPVQ